MPSASENLPPKGESSMLLLTSCLLPPSLSTLQPCMPPTQHNHLSCRPLVSMALLASSGQTTPSSHMPRPGRTRLLDHTLKFTCVSINLFNLHPASVIVACSRVFCSVIMTDSYYSET
ncbi:hypothetical protein ATANTOWER_009019 [Ataeniobius toweri]|uniref:Uncharacterized protein n=1 Tax=Ataeniobius toweri TaxID=208326 RepID=A0ABU7BEM8_9TELE|nr:hypothetical protein [Ataeniobius toweri]